MGIFDHSSRRAFVRSGTDVELELDGLVCSLIPHQTFSQIWDLKEIL